MLNQVENTILDSYGTDYTGAHVRNMVVTGRVDKLSLEIKDSMIAVFNRFSNWNNSYCKTIPDTLLFSDGIKYMKNI
jgi:hypothetical protein